MTSTVAFFFGQEGYRYLLNIYRMRNDWLNDIGVNENEWLIEFDKVIDWLSWYDWLIDLVWLKDEWLIDWVGIIEWWIDWVWYDWKTNDWLIELVWLIDEWLIDWVGIIERWLIGWFQLAWLIDWSIDWLIDCSWNDCVAALGEYRGPNVDVPASDSHRCAMLVVEISHKEYLLAFASKTLRYQFIFL